MLFRHTLTKLRLLHCT